MKIFWSWQDDSAGKVNRHFIKAALKDAIAAIEGDYEAEDADRPELDHDTKGVAGAREVVPIIMGKIATSAVFVADVTPIGKSAKGKALPNPNVMVELGWSLNSPGDGRQIYILNNADGWKVEDLPFDIRHRRVLTYTLAESSDTKVRERVRKELVKDLIAAIKLILKEHLDEKAQVAPAVGVAAKADEMSIWADGESGLRHLDSEGRGIWKEVKIRTGARAYLRVIPTGWSAEPPTAAEIRNLDMSVVPLPAPHGNGGDHGLTKDGHVRYWVASNSNSPPPVEVENVSRFFESNGEFWILHGSSILERHDKKRFLSLADLFSEWASSLRRTHWLFDHYGALSARKVEVGLTGVEGVFFPGGWNLDSVPARRNEMEFDLTRRDWSTSPAQEDFLAEAFDKVFDLFGLDRRSAEETRTFLGKNDPERGRKNPHS